jgi:hypothetical protein
LKGYCALDDPIKELLQSPMVDLNLSACAYDRILPCRQPVAANPVGFGTMYKFRTDNGSILSPAGPKISIGLRSSSSAAPKTGQKLLLGLSPMCSTVQYTFPGILRPACPFESESKKLTKTNKIRHFKHVC